MSIEAQINDLRLRVVKGEDVSPAELAQAIAHHRSLRGRFAAAAEPETKKKTKEVSPDAKASAENILKDLGL